MRVRRVMVRLLPVALIAWSALGAQPDAAAQDAPDGGTPIVFSSSEGIVRIDEDGSGRQVLATPTDERPRLGGPDVSSDGSSVAFVACVGLATGALPLDCVLQVVSIDGGPVRTVTDGLAYSPKWSPDGSRIAFDSFTGHEATVMVVPSTGGTARPIGAGTVADWNAAGSGVLGWRHVWTDDAGSANPVRTDLVRFGADGQPETTLRRDTGPTSGGATSPDGGQLVFARETTVAVVNVDGSGLRDLAGIPGRHAQAWAPDGTRLATVGDPSSPTSLIELHDLVTGATTTVPNTAGARHVSWTAPSGSTPCTQGYWLLGGDGGVFTYGNARFHGSTGGMRLNAPVVGMAASRSGAGYWSVASDGGVFSFGDAAFHGSTGGMSLNRPVVGMAATPSGGGYWLVASDGGVFSFGDAGFHGSTGGMSLNRPVVGMAATPSGGGYWLVASDGGVFSFGDARFHGSTGGRQLEGPVRGMATTSTGDGYWLFAADGRIFPFGASAPTFTASSPGLGSPLVAMSGEQPGGTATAGVLAASADGGVILFGGAQFCGSRYRQPLAQPIVGVARRP